jgi:thiol:disulfide interchange protein
MRRATLAILVLLAACLAAPAGQAGAAGDGPGVAWLGLEQALARRQDRPRPVVVFFHLPWCSRCQKMERTTYADPAVVRRLNAETWPARVDMNRRRDLAERYGVDFVPTHVFLGPGGGEAFRVEDVIPPGRYLRLLDRLGPGR